MNKETDKDEIEEEPENNRLLPVVRANESLARLDPLTAYLREIRQYEGLSEEEEHALAVKYKKTGDLNAAYRLTTAHLMMVVRIAMTFKREWNTMMDLVQE